MDNERPEGADKDLPADIDREQARAARGILMAQAATNKALRDLSETCRELQEQIDEAHVHMPSGHLRVAIDPAMPRLPPATPLWG